MTATVSSKAAANAAPRPRPSGRASVGGKGLFRYAPEALPPDILNNFIPIHWPTFTPPHWPGFAPPLTGGAVSAIRSSLRAMAGAMPPITINRNRRATLPERPRARRYPTTKKATQTASRKDRMSCCSRVMKETSSTMKKAAKPHNISKTACIVGFDAREFIIRSLLTWAITFLSDPAYRQIRMMQLIGSKCARSETPYWCVT